MFVVSKIIPIFAVNSNQSESMKFKEFKYLSFLFAFHSIFRNFAKIILLL